MAAERFDAPTARVLGDVTGGVRYDVAAALTRAARLLLRPQAGGRYVVKRELARGGMGVIHVAFDQDLGRVSAMKVVAPNVIEEQRKLMSFIEEGRITALLEHPNIIPVHELGTVEGTGFPYYTMKLVEGEALSEIIFKCGRGLPDYLGKFTRHRLVDIFRKVCDAVSYAHSRGVIHRDIKPENIMVGQFGEVVLMDWGLAKFIEDADRTDVERALDPRRRDAGLPHTHTEDGVIKGSPAYLSPEQAFGDLSKVDRQSDIFLLGATLYHMLTGHPPYFSEDFDELLAKAEKCDFLPPSARNPSAQIPLALERVIMKAMAPLKTNRYATVQELTEDLDAFLSGKRVCGRQIFAPGEKLIQCGDVSLDTYVIVSGRVQISRVIGGEEHPIGILGHGDIIGEMAGITHQVRSATITALETTEVLVISRELLLEELEKLPPWMEKIVFSLAERIRFLDGTVHPLMLKERAYPVINEVFHLLAGVALGGQRQEANCAKSCVIEEVALTLGIDRESIVKVVNVLINHGLLVEDAATAQLAAANLKDFALFVDFCRYHFGIRGGIKEIAAIQLTPDLSNFFGRVLRSLRALRSQTDPSQRAAPAADGPSPAPG